MFTEHKSHYAHQGQIAIT